jgi:hypothetical protein
MIRGNEKCLEEHRKEKRVSRNINLSHIYKIFRAIPGMNSFFFIWEIMEYVFVILDVSSYA